jgi:hypothetical protein
MKTEKTIKEKNWVLPGVNLTHEEFVAGIRKAEEGPFYTIEEVQIIRNQWRNSKKDQ